MRIPVTIFEQLDLSSFWYKNEKVEVIDFGKDGPSVRTYIDIKWIEGVPYRVYKQKVGLWKPSNAH